MTPRFLAHAVMAGLPSTDMSKTSVSITCLSVSLADFALNVV